MTSLDTRLSLLHTWLLQSAPKNEEAVLVLEAGKDLYKELGILSETRKAVMLRAPDQPVCIRYTDNFDKYLNHPKNDTADITCHVEGEVDIFLKNLAVYLQAQFKAKATPVKYKGGPIITINITF